MRAIVLGVGLLASSVGPTEAANPACANMAATAVSAVSSLVIQGNRLREVCNDKGWDSGPCAAQAAVVAGAAVWAWWTISQYYCGCSANPPVQYCAAIGLLPAPPAPPAVGGGAIPPPGPPPPANPGKEPEPAPEPSATEVE
jgi:hypothetical protein